MDNDLMRKRLEELHARRPGSQLAAIMALAGALLVTAVSAAIAFCLSPFALWELWRSEKPRQKGRD
jgi:hypothetical protein